MLTSYQREEIKNQRRTDTTNFINVLLDSIGRKRETEAQQRVRDAQANYYNSMAGMLGGVPQGVPQPGMIGGFQQPQGQQQGQIPYSQPSPQDILNAYAQQTGQDPEDFMFEPKTYSYRGRAITSTVPVLKPAVPPAEINDLQSIREIFKKLDDNISLVGDPDVRKYMSPADIRARRGTIPDTILNLQSLLNIEKLPAEKFSSFKAETDKLFQDFRKKTTGAQAALKELGWLEPDYPRSSDTPEIYLRKAYYASLRWAEAEQLLYDLYSQRGYRVGELKGGSLEKTRQSDLQEARRFIGGQGDIGSNEPPQYDPRTQKLQTRIVDGRTEYRVVPR